MANFLINGLEIPFPDIPFPYTLNDISTPDSGRDLSASMCKDEVAKKVTLACTWTRRSWGDTSKVLKAIKTSTYVEVVYPDAYEGDYVTKTFYSGDVNSELVSCDGELFWTTKLTLIEQ